MILSNETNKVYFSAHLKADYPIFFKRIKTVLEQNNIIVDLLQETNDYWCRDYMPIQVNKDRFVIYKYFPDYLNKPTKICYITNVEKTLSYLGIADNQTIDLSDIVIDGGNVVKTPYHVIMTEKIFIENPTISHDKLISRLELAFQSEIIIVPWTHRRKDQCGHTDGMVRYVKGHELLLDNYTKFDKITGKRIHKILERVGYTVHELDLPDTINNSWAYINFLQTANVIVIPNFNLIADNYAHKHISSLFNVPVVQIPAPNIIKKYGGAFNCMTWNIKI